MKRPLVVAAAALALATPSLAALPHVHARAYLLEDGQTGQVLAQYRPHARVPIASITKLMTVLLTLEHTKPSDVVSEAVEAVSKAKPVRSGPKVGRNDPCPCGSGKKHKNCCGK